MMPNNAIINSHLEGHGTVSSYDVLISVQSAALQKKFSNSRKIDLLLMNINYIVIFS